MPAKPRRLVTLPGRNPNAIDPAHVSCVRVVAPEGGAALVVVHTIYGYAVECVPRIDQSVAELHAETLSALGI